MFKPKSKLYEFMTTVCGDKVTSRHYSYVVQRCNWTLYETSSKLLKLQYASSTETFLTQGY